MVIDVTKVIKDFEDNAIIDSGKELTLRTVFYMALNSFRSDENPSADTKAKCFGIMTKIFAGDEANITNEEAVLLKERVGVIFTPLIYGMVCEVLDS